MLSRRAFLQHASSSLVAACAGPAVAAAQPTSAQSTTAKPTTALRVFHDRATLGHEPSASHPESPARMGAVMTAVEALEKQGRLTMGRVRHASDDDVLLVHSPAYLKTVRSEIVAGRRMLSTGDTEISGGSLTAALAAAGAVLSGVDAVMSGEARRAFCAVRPPGHHASQNRGMGFCVFNNIAIGARYARRRYGVERVLIADWDVHHGNGTQDVFWNDGAVLFFDTHQHPWYPGTGAQSETGEGKASGLIFNRPFPAGSGRRDILGVFRDVLVPAADKFKPQLVMISSGFDSRAGDPLGQFTLSDADFADLTDTVADIARTHAGGRIVSVLEGGYALDGLSRAVASHLGRLSS